MNKIVVLHLKSKLEKAFKVDVFLKTLNIAEQLCREDFAKVDNDYLDETIEQLESNMHSQQACLVEVTCIYSPYCFYVNRRDSLLIFGPFQKRLQDHYKAEASLG